MAAKLLGQAARAVNSSTTQHVFGELFMLVVCCLFLVPCDELMCQFNACTVPVIGIIQASNS